MIIDVSSSRSSASCSRGGSASEEELEGHAAWPISIVEPVDRVAARAPRACRSSARLERLIDHVEDDRVVGQAADRSIVERRLAGHAERARVDQQIAPRGSAVASSGSASTGRARSSSSKRLRAFAERCG